MRTILAGPARSIRHVWGSAAVIRRLAGVARWGVSVIGRRTLLRRRSALASARLQSRYEREFFGSLNEEQQKTYRTLAGSVMLFDIE